MSPTLLLLMLTLVGCRWIEDRMGRRDLPPPAERTAPDDAPNVLLISVDTLRSDHLPFYGYGRATAPALTRLAAEAAVFELVYAASPATDGSHATMFTGLHQSEHGKFSHEQRLDAGALTLAEHLHAQGWRTQGWASTYKFIVRSGLDQGFDQWTNFHKTEKNERSAKITAGVLRLIDDPDPAPWFAFAHYFDVHAPYAAPEPYASAYVAGVAPAAPAETGDYISANRKSASKVRPAHIEALKGMYDGQIRFVDAQLAPVLERLGVGGARPKPAANGRPTLVVITSDHGEAFMEAGYLGHSVYLHEAIVRVPWMVWWPGAVRPIRVPQPAMGVDLLPTVVELVGAPAVESSGLSFASQLRGGAPTVPDNRVLMLQSPQYWAVAQRRPEGLFKLTTRPKDGGAARLLQRVDIDRHDPREQRESHPVVYAELSRALESFPFKDPQGRSVQRTDISAEEREQLEAMGYIEHDDD